MLVTETESSFKT